VVPVPRDDQPTQRAPVVLVDGLTREQVLGVVGNARATSDAPLDLEGHGSSGIAVLSLVLHQRRLGLDIAHAACLDARGGDDPVTGRPLAAPTPPKVATRLTFVPGKDEASRTWTTATADAFRAAGWPVDLLD
jgi:hypothetical protein